MRKGALRLRSSIVGLVLGLTLGLLPAVTGVLQIGHVGIARADDLTASLDNLRTGWDPNEPTLTPAVVHSGAFQQLFSTAVNGQVYAQPLVVGSTVIVATENDWVYGLDTITGAVKWSVSLGTPYNIPWCTDLQPNIGVTGTPIYDSANGNVYLVAQVVTAKGYVQYHMFAIKAQTGAIKLDKYIGGHPSNDSSITFNGKFELPRPGLLLMNGWVYAAFGSHCDHQPYAGYVAGINVSTKAETLWTDESGVTDDQAGIWQSGDGLMSDGPGRIFFTSGNGISPPPGSGSAPPGQLAESTVRLAVQANGSLAAQDFFSPADAPSLDAADTDFGSGGPVGLPYGTTTYPHVLVQAGKDGRIFLLNRDNLGGREQGPGSTDAVLSEVGPFAGQWGHPAVFEASTAPLASGSTGTGDYVYYVGRDDYLRTLQLSASATGNPVLTDIANSSFRFEFSSGSPVVTSNGTDPSSAILWLVRASGASGANGTLYAYDGEPPGSCTGSSPCTQKPIWSAPIGTASKFTIPATSNGMVYVGTRDGNVLGFGLSTATPLRGGRPVSFRRTRVGSAVTRTVTIAVSKKVTVSAISAATTASDVSSPASQFALGQVTESRPHHHKRVRVKFPVNLWPGDALHVSMTFTPAVAGGATGVLSLATGAGRLPFNVPLYGDGIQTGLQAATTALSYKLVLGDGSAVSNVPVGIALQQTVQITNGGSSPQTVTSVRGPGNPFIAAGLPRLGTIIHPGQSITVEVTFAPQRMGRVASAFTIAGSSGTRAKVHLSGVGQVPVSKVTTPARVDFGRVRVGHAATAWIHITNVGNQPAVTAGTAAPRSPFHTPYKVAKGLAINSGYDLRIQVTFTPETGGPFASSYRFTWTDRLGTHTATIPMIGEGVDKPAAAATPISAKVPFLMGH